MGVFYLYFSAPKAKKRDCSWSHGAHMPIVFVCRTRIRLGKIRVSLAICWTPSVVVLVSLHTVIAVTDSFDLVYSAIYTIPPLNSTQNYVPPQRDSTSDLKCDCDSVMYRWVSVWANCCSDRLTDRGGHTVFIWRVRRARVVGFIRESFSVHVHSLYVQMSRARADDYRVGTQVGKVDRPMR